MNWEELNDVPDDDAMVDPEAMAILNDLMSKVPDAFDKILTAREERIIRMRFGIKTNPMFLKDIAAEFNVQPERIRQVEAKAMRKLRRSKLFRDIVKPYAKDMPWWKI